jgi:hypothetical protein
MMIHFHHFLSPLIVLFSYFLYTLAALTPVVTVQVRYKSRLDVVAKRSIITGVGKRNLAPQLVTKQCFG